MADIKDLKEAVEEFQSAIENTDAIDRFGTSIENLLNEIDSAPDKLEELKKKFADLKKEVRDSLSTFDKFNSQLERTIKTFTGVTDSSNTLVGSFLNMAKEQETLGGVVDKVKESFDKQLTSFNIGISVFQKLTEGSVALALANDKAIASFNAATGAGGRYNDQIVSLEKENRKFGIGAAESAAALQGLISGLSGFGLMAEDVQTSLADEVAELEKLGVAGADTIGVFQSATKTFGLTTEASEGLVQQAEGLAQALGISVGQAVGDLNKALPQLAVLSGDEVAGAFERLSEQAVETGLSIDQLTSIADRFMTFEAAGKAASSLNAVLGTQMFDTMSLLEAQLEGPQAFIDTFREQLQGSVGDFDSLTVFQKQAIANASGMSVVELRNLMNAEALTEEQRKQAKAREENLKATMDIFAELKALGAELTVALKPAIDAISFILSKMASFLELSRKAGEALGGGVGGALGTIAGGMAVAKGGSFLKDKISSALGFAGKKLGTKDNPMFVKDVDSKTDDAVDAGKSIFSKLMGKIPKPKWMDKIPGLGKLGGFAKKLGPLAKLGGRFVPGLNLALLGGDALKIGSKFFADGTDNYPGGPLLNVAGEAGKELIVPPPGSAIINNQNTEKLAKMGGTGAGGNQAVVAAINNLSTKMDALMQRLGAPGDFVLTVNRREFARLTNEHFGAPGSSPVSGVG
jgi:hypothetical protein